MQGRAKVIVSKTNVNFIVRQKPNVIEITRVRILIHLSGVVRGRVLEAGTVRAQHSLYKLGVAHVKIVAYGIVKGRATKAIFELNVGSVFQEIAHDMHMTLTRAQVEPCAIVIVALVGPYSVCNEALDLVEIALECCLAHEHTQLIARHAEAEPRSLSTNHFCHPVALGKNRVFQRRIAQFVFEGGVGFQPQQRLD